MNDDRYKTKPGEWRLIILLMLAIYPPVFAIALLLSNLLL